MDRWEVFEDEDTCKLYNITDEEYKTILAIRAGEAKIVLVPKNRQIPRVGDFDEYNCRILSTYEDGSYLHSSPYTEEEVEEAIAKEGAKRVIVNV